MISLGSFELYGAGRIVFGRGTFARSGELAAGWGTKAIVLTNADRTGKQGLMDRLDALLDEHGVSAKRVWLTGEPQLADVDAAADQARELDCDLVIGIGGGSAIDAAKAVAGLLTNGGQTLDYLEVIGRGKKFDKPAAPILAIPTTAGTGAEVTRNAVIGSPEHGRKASLRSEHLLPRVVIVDPELHVPVWREVTVRAGMDAVTQLIESFTSARANPVTDALAREGLTRAARSLRRACDQPDDVDARADMALAALLSGLTLSSAGLGAVHGFAGPIGGLYPAPHGAVCAALLPHVMRANIAGLRAQDTSHPLLERYRTIGSTLNGAASAAGDVGDAMIEADAGVDTAQALVRDFEIPGLGSYGMTEADIPRVIEMSRATSSMRTNPVQHTDDALAGILRAAL